MKLIWICWSLFFILMFAVHSQLCRLKLCARFIHANRCWVIDKTIFTSASAIDTQFVDCDVQRTTDCDGEIRKTLCFFFSGHFSIKLFPFVCGNVTNGNETIELTEKFVHNYLSGRVSLFFSFRKPKLFNNAKSTHFRYQRKLSRSHAGRQLEVERITNQFSKVFNDGVSES